MKALLAKLSSKQKIYGGIIAAGLAALVTDQLTRPATVLTETAEARPLPMMQAHIAPRPAAVTVNSQNVTELLRSASKKGEWLSALDARDPFRPTLAWGVAAVATQAPAAPTSAARFAAAHRLTGVVISGTQRHAMVDGRILGIGQQIDGFTLTAIASRTAIFESNGSRIIVTLEERAPGGPSASIR